MGEPGEDRRAGGIREPEHDHDDQAGPVQGGARSCARPRACPGVCLAFMMRLALEQAIGRTAAEAVVEVFGEPVTANEAGWLRMGNRTLRSRN